MVTSQSNDPEPNERARGRPYYIEPQRGDICRHAHPPEGGRERSKQRRAETDVPMRRPWDHRGAHARNIRSWRQLGADNDLLEKCGVSLRGNTMAQSTKDDHPLSGVRVLIVEDDPLMAMDL